MRSGMQRALRVLLFLARSAGDEKDRREERVHRRVLFERAPAIINLPGELFRAIDVESAVSAQRAAGLAALPVYAR